MIGQLPVSQCESDEHPPPFWIFDVIGHLCLCESHDDAGHKHVTVRKQPSYRDCKKIKEREWKKSEKEILGSVPVAL